MELEAQEILRIFVAAMLLLSLTYLDMRRSSVDEYDRK